MPSRRHISLRILNKKYGERRKIRMTHNNIHTQKTPHSSYHCGRASTSTSYKGSITIEAAMAVPVFFFAVLCLVYLLEVMAIQTSVRSGLSYAGKVISQENYPINMVDPGKVEEYIVNAIGADRLERSIVVGGSTGIDCSKSNMSLRTGIGKLSAAYQIRIPVPMFVIDGITREETIKIKTWTGYEREFLGDSKEETVYVTETGLVYHRDYHCTYLDLSIQMVPAANIESLRNNDGGKYYACRICGGGNNAQVYITGSGNKYHGSLSCSGLKRTVYAVPLSEVIGKGACNRCGR